MPVQTTQVTSILPADHVPPLLPQAVRDLQTHCRQQCQLWTDPDQHEAVLWQRPYSVPRAPPLQPSSRPVDTSPHLASRPARNNPAICTRRPICHTLRYQTQRLIDQLLNTSEARQELLIDTTNYRASRRHMALIRSTKASLVAILSCDDVSSVASCPRSIPPRSRGIRSLLLELELLLRWRRKGRGRKTCRRSVATTSRSFGIDAERLPARIPCFSASPTSILDCGGSERRIERELLELDGDASRDSELPMCKVASDL
ncbi:hypothetical protein CCR75_004857 [Bremia lactucae]|uniref:Uncharacterized protein n=1 Tax=Bremia lactucae TaxID=4779 RepID=A0A976FHX8_BRELC|nr:hypothetical protein CCR75_004857 [Bremia lactucae]